MFTKQTAKMAEKLVVNGLSAEGDKDIISYGLSVAIDYALCVVTTVIFGLLFDIMLESLLFLGAFSFLRTYAGGYHCKTAIQCYFVSIGTVFIVLMLVKFTPQEYMGVISALLLLIAIPLIWEFSPIGTTTKPLDEVEKKHYRKITIRNLMIECCVICALFVLELHSFAFTVSLGVVITGGVVVWGW